MSKCPKPGCGATNAPGNPCHDHDCPQKWVHHTQAQSSAGNSAKRDSQQGFDQVAHLERQLQEARAALKASRETNRSLHRRVQELESSEAVKARKEGYWELRGRVDHLSQAWLREFDRVIFAHGQLKKVYEVAAPVLGLPYGRYHSVMDSAFIKSEEMGKGVFANVYLTPKGGVETYDVVDTVRKAIATLQDDTRSPS